MSEAKRKSIAQLLFVLFILVLPASYDNISGWLKNPGSTQIRLFGDDLWAFYLGNLKIYLPIFIMFFLSGERLAELGLRKMPVRTALIHSIALTAIMFVAVTAVAALAMRLIPNAGALIRTPQKMRDFRLFFAVLPLFVLIPIAEELVFRSFIYAKLQTFVRSKYLTMLITSLIFALPHIYQGPLACLVTFVMAILFSWYFVRMDNLIAPIVAHFIKNFLGLVVMFT